MKQQTNETKPKATAVVVLMAALLYGASAPCLSVTNASMTIYDATKPAITLNGASEVSVVLGAAYSDAGASASDNLDGDITGRVQVSGTVNASAAGTYTLTYTVTDLAGNAASVARTVRVIDQRKPVITLQGQPQVTLEVGTPYTDLGAKALDGAGNDITGAIEVAGQVNNSLLGLYNLTYTVIASNGFEADPVTRSVNVVDTTKPVLTLKGQPVVEVAMNAVYTDAGATATDNYDGEISQRIQVAGLPVDTSKAGSFPVFFSVSDSSGNAATQVTRTVKVTAPVAGLKVTWPVDGAKWYVGGLETLPVVITAAADSPVEYVELKLDGDRVAMLLRAPYTFSGNLDVVSGTHALTATAKVKNSTVKLNKEIVFTVVAPDPSLDNDGNGLPDNPFTALPNPGDAWFVANNGHVTGVVNLDPAATESLTASVVAGPETTVAVTASPALCAADADTLLVFAMGETLDSVFGTDAAALRPEPAGYAPAPGSRYVAATVIQSFDDGVSYSELDESLLAAYPLGVRLQKVVPDAEKETLFAAHALVADADDEGFFFAGGVGDWHHALLSSPALAGSVFTCGLTGSACVMVYQEDASNVDQAAPALTIATPAAHALVTTAQVVVTGTASDETGAVGGLDRVEVWLDDALVQTVAVTGRSASWVADVTLPDAGLYTVTAQAVDAVGNVSAVATVTIQYGAIGDVDMNGAINATDAKMIGYLAVMDEATLNGWLVAKGVSKVDARFADINLDGRIDSIDATLLRHVLKYGKDATNQALAAQGMSLVHVGEPLPQQ